MEWIKAKEKTPDRPGKIVVKIADRYFFGEVRNCTMGFYYKYADSYVDYEFSYMGHGKEAIKIGNWKKPSHFAEVDYYCYLPEENNLT